MSRSNGRMITVLQPGPLAVVVDLGRPGHAHLGVPPAGALDVPALRLANRLVGNPEAAAGLELLMGQAELRAESSCEVAVTGPPVPLRVTAASSSRPTRTRAVSSHRAVHLEPGEVVAVAGPSSGLRNYVAVSGGVDVPPVMGSRSADLLSGLGPSPLRAGQRLPLGPVQGAPPEAGVVPASEVAARASVAVMLGPRHDWFSDPTGVLRTGRWEVSPASNRIGLRLAGPALTRRAEYRDRELPSEPMLTGSIQVPPDGQPMIFLADHPTTGGYPVLGVVLPDDLPVLAQARPGTTVRLRPVGSAGT
ncbi:MAG: biotin-dependent carboxyltransferase family protein [Pseudonocardia sp.]